MAPSFTAQSLSKKCERGRREDRTEKSRAVNTGAKIHRFVGAAIHLCWQKHCRIIASFSSRKSRSSYPYKLEKPVSGPRPCCKVRRQQSCCPPPWVCLLLCFCPPPWVCLLPCFCPPPWVCLLLCFCPSKARLFC